MKNIERIYDGIRSRQREALRRRTEDACARVPQLDALQNERRTLFADTAAKRLSPEAARVRLRAIADAEAALLENAGIAKDALTLQYDCAQCRDTGYLGGSLKRPCACRLKLRAKLDPSLLINEEQTFEAFDAAIYAQPAQREQALRIKQYCEQYIEQMPAPRPPNLLFLGMAGLGKTFFGNAIAYRALEHGVDAARTTAYGFMQDTLTSLRGDRQIVLRYHTAPLLVLDDLGTEPVIPNVSEEALFALINERSSRRLPTVIATNLSFAQLQSRYGERVFSRLSDTATTRVLHLQGENLRWRKNPC